MTIKRERVCFERIYDVSTALLQWNDELMILVTSLKLIII